MTTQTKDIVVENISCGHCVATIEREIGEIAGVEDLGAPSLATDERKRDQAKYKHRGGCPAR